jgi:molecular chaperone DnaK
MIKDAEKYAEDDAKRRETVETRNQADQLVNQTETLLAESGEQMTDGEKEAVESSLAELKANLEDDSTETEMIRKSMDALIETSQAMATRLYQQAAQAQAADGDSAESDEDDDIVEAEIVDEDNDDEQSPETTA